MIWGALILSTLACIYDWKYLSLPFWLCALMGIVGSIMIWYTGFPHWITICILIFGLLATYFQHMGFADVIFLYMWSPWLSPEDWSNFLILSGFFGIGFWIWFKKKYYTSHFPLIPALSIGLILSLGVSAQGSYFQGFSKKQICSKAAYWE